MSSSLELPSAAEIRRLTDARIRREIAPVLRAAGFRARSRRWLREAPDRVDIVSLVTLDGHMRFEFGTYLVAAHAEGSPYARREGPFREADLDLYWSDPSIAARRWALDDSVAVAARARLAEAIIPWLDSLYAPDRLSDTILGTAVLSGAALHPPGPESAAMASLRARLQLAAGERPSRDLVEIALTFWRWARSDASPGDIAWCDEHVAYWERAGENR